MKAVGNSGRMTGTRDVWNKAAENDRRQTTSALMRDVWNKAESNFCAARISLGMIRVPLRSEQVVSGDEVVQSQRKGTAAGRSLVGLIFRDHCQYHGRSRGLIVGTYLHSIWRERRCRSCGLGQPCLPRCLHL
jgi:hypothetical protein